MAETTGDIGAATQTTDNAGESPAPNVLPDGHTAVSQADLDRYKGLESQIGRYQENVQGMEPYMKWAQERGFKTPESLAELEPLLGLVPENMTTAQYARAMATEVGDAAPAGGLPPEFQVEIDKIRGEFSEFRNESVMDVHKAAIGAETDAFGKMLDGILGDAQDQEKELVHAAAAHLYEKERYARDGLGYDSKHPLHGKTAGPLGEVALKGLVEKIGKMRTLKAGEEAAARGDEVNNATGKKQPGVAGSAQGQGKPNTQDGDEERGLMGVKRSDAEAALARRQSARKGKPMSSAAG